MGRKILHQSDRSNNHKINYSAEAGIGIDVATQAPGKKKKIVFSLLLLVVCARAGGVVKALAIVRLGVVKFGRAGRACTHRSFHTLFYSSGLRRARDMQFASFVVVWSMLHLPCGKTSQNVVE